MKDTIKKLTGNIACIFLLIVCLIVTTAALASASVTSENHLFGTGKVAISLNGGEAIITETEFLFEPGMKVEKEFYVENTGTCDVWYRLYFSNVSGGLADVLEISVIGKDGSVLYNGKMADLVFDEDNPPAVPDTALGIGEKRVLKLLFHYPEDASSDSAGAYLSFDFVADATQKKNNDAKEFD